eukprot:13185987-Alexandrium_andersonii.AAC.1
MEAPITLEATRSQREPPRHPLGAERGKAQGPARSSLSGGKRWAAGLPALAAPPTRGASPEHGRLIAR